MDLTGESGVEGFLYRFDHSIPVLSSLQPLTSLIYGYVTNLHVDFHVSSNSRQRAYIKEPGYIE